MGSTSFLFKSKKEKKIKTITIQFNVISFITHFKKTKRKKKKKKLSLCFISHFPSKEIKIIRKNKLNQKILIRIQTELQNFDIFQNNQLK